MKLKGLLLLVFMLIITSSGLAGCATTTPEPPTATPTPDLCAPENVRTEVEKIHRLTRSFDDTSQIAANSPREQVAGPTSALQAVRREAEDQRIPPCLVALKRAQLNHMNAVINTLIAFMGGANADTVNQGIQLARQQRNQYDTELARLLGITLAPMPTMPPLPTAAPGLPTPMTETPAAPAPSALPPTTAP